MSCNRAPRLVLDATGVGVAVTVRCSLAPCVDFPEVECHTIINHGR